jgi:iron complex transport system ATP-binding protein
LIGRPALLILDEPCAGLDPAARADFLALLQQLPTVAKGTSVVLVTHHVEEIVPVFTHALLLRNGSKLAAGPVAATLRRPQLAKLFGRPVVLTKARSGWSLRTR